jgi:hypothetical protein
MPENPIAVIEKEQFSLTPRSLSEAMEFAKIMSDSDLVPKDYRGKPGNVLVAIQMGQEVGLKPIQAVQNIAVINGRPAIWGDALLALCMPHIATIMENFDEESQTAYCSVTRKNGLEGHGQWSMEDAKRFECAFAPGEGTCGGMYTANTMASVAEALGMSLPGSASPASYDRRRDYYAHKSGEAVV